MLLDMRRNRPADGDWGMYNHWKPRGITTQTVADRVKDKQYLTRFRDVFLGVLAGCVPNLRVFESSDPLCYSAAEAGELHRVLLQHRRIRHIDLSGMAFHFPQNPVFFDENVWKRKLRQALQDADVSLYGPDDYEDDDESDGERGDDADDEDLDECCVRSCLKSLSFDVTACDGSAAVSLLIMLSRSHLTLQQLRIVPGNTTLTFGPDPLVFERLRHLDVSEACYLSRNPRTFLASGFDASTWRQLLAPSLESLCFPNTKDKGFREALAATPDLPALKHVTAGNGIHHPRRGDSWRAPHRFLRRHAAQLEELRLGASSLWVASRILRHPDRWSRLSTLRLAIRVPSFDVAAIGDTSPPSITLPAGFIMALAGLPALESLYLAVGCGAKWKH